MEVEFTLTTDDLLALDRRLQEPEESFLRARDLADGSRLRRPDWKRWRWALWLLVALAAGAAVLAGRGFAVWIGAASLLVYWGAAVALAALGVVYCVSLHSRHVLRQRLHHHPWNLWTRGPVRISLTPEGVTEVT